MKAITCQQKIRAAKRLKVLQKKAQESQEAGELQARLWASNGRLKAV